MSAASKFIKTEELLLLTLKSTDPETLLMSQRVCKHWSTLIKHERNLQEKLFLPNASSERIVLAEAGEEEFEAFLNAGYSIMGALRGLREDCGAKFWTFEQGVKAPVEVKINPLLSKIFVRDAGDAFLSWHAIVDLRTTEEPGADLPGGGEDAGAGEGTGVRTWVAGAGFPGFGAPIEDGEDYSAELTGVPGEAEVGFLDEVPGLALLPGKGKAGGRYVCDGGSFEEMALTSPPIHRVRVLTRFIDGPMYGDNFMRYDTGGRPLTVGYLLRKLQRLAAGSSYKLCWVRIVGEELFLPE